MGVNGFVFPRPEGGADCLEGLLGVPARPIAVAAFMEVSLEDRLEQKEQRHLHDSIFHRRYAEGTLLAVILRYPDPEHRTGPVIKIPPLILKYMKGKVSDPCYLCLLQPIHSGCSAV